MNPPSDQKRLILAVVISTGILLLWYALFPPTAPKPQPPGGAPASGAATASGAPASTPAAPGSAAPATAPAFAGEKATTVATLTVPDRQEVEFGNLNGDIRRWSILESQYRDRQGAFVLAQPPERSAARGTFLPPLLELQLGGEASDLVYTGAQQGDVAVMSATDPKTGVRITRKYTLDPEKYEVVATVTLENPGGAPVPYDLAGLIRASQHADEASGNMFSPPIYLYEALCGQADDLEREQIDAVTKIRKDPEESARFTQGVRWGGVDNRYFLSALLPEGQPIEACEMFTGAEAAKVAEADKAPRMSYVAVRLELEGGTVPAGGQVARTVRLFGGPKKYEVLKTTEPPLTGSVDFGIFRVISLPMLWLMRQFFELIPNWGLAIILLTIVVKLLTWPLTQKQYKSMAGMKKVQPQLKALQEKYKDDRLRLQQEMMKLYKEHNVNPLSGCLPVVMMMPVYFALYRTIYSAVELYKADLGLWIHDLSEMDPFFILPIVLGVLMLVQARLSPTQGDAATQKMMMYFMPIMFTAMMAFLPSGLVLYILVNTALGIAQQWYMLKRGETQTAAPTPAKARGR